MASARIAMLSRERRSSVKAQTAAAAEAAAAAAAEREAKAEKEAMALAKKMEGRLQLSNSIMFEIED